MVPTCRCLMRPISSIWRCPMPTASSPPRAKSAIAVEWGRSSAMPTPILMPALSPTMTEGKLAKWLKKEGDTVKSGDVLAEIETDKATMEVEAVDEGTLGKILVAAGTDDVAVNTPIAVILGEGEKPGDAPKAAPAPAAQ